MTKAKRLIISILVTLLVGFVYFYLLTFPKVSTLTFTLGGYTHKSVL